VPRSATLKHCASDPTTINSNISGEIPEMHVHVEYEYTIDKKNKASFEKGAPKQKQAKQTTLRATVGGLDG